MVGEHILYNGEEYVISFRYTSEYYEIVKINNHYHVDVHFSQIEKISKNDIKNN